MIISHRNAQRILMSSLLQPKILCRPSTRLKQTVVAELDIFNEFYQTTKKLVHITNNQGVF